ncbi:MAG: cupin domain-containing protein [Clostridia bacterium]|nr:cupin domain-containing protein [Clostridia bacterium]
MVDKVDLRASANSISELFKYLKVGHLNDHMLNIVVAKDRTLDFHIHEESDEMFYIIDGKMQMEFDDSIVDLATGDFIIVPKGKRHRPVCKTLVKCLLIEKAGILSKANTGGTYTE